MLSCVMALSFGAADAERKSNEEVTATVPPPSELYVLFSVPCSQHQKALFCLPQ